MPDLYIGGRWESAREGERREIRCPADGSLVAEVDEAGPEDTRAAITAAREAFDEGSWSGSSTLERGALLHRVAALLERDKDAVARAESLDTGKRLVDLGDQGTVRGAADLPALPLTRGLPTPSDE